MDLLFRGILRLYPAEYRDTFGAEMFDTFRHASNQRRTQGSLPLLFFAVTELIGLMHGLFSEWRAKRAAPQTYITSRCCVQDATSPPIEVVDARRRVDQLIRCMEFAIAHHDFPKARYYSDQERIARAQWQHLAGGNRA